MLFRSVRRMVWSYWHVDLYATPSPRTLPTPHTMSADVQPTVSVGTTAHTPHDCHRMLRVDNSTVESPSTESLQRPRASMSPRAHYSSPHSDSSSPFTRSQSLDTPLHSQSPRTPLPTSTHQRVPHCQSPRAPSASQDAQVFQQSDTLCWIHRIQLLQRYLNTSKNFSNPPSMTIIFLLH